VNKAARQGAIKFSAARGRGCWERLQAVAVVARPRWYDLTRRACACNAAAGRARTVNVQSERICAILNKMERIVAIGEAADVLGVSIATLRRWEAAGKLAAEPTAAGIAAMMSPSDARNCSVTPTPRSERQWLMRVSRRTLARPALAAVRSRPNWICRNACFVAGLADSWRIGTATLRKNLNDWPQALRCQPVERRALARFARAA
jgi:hypothetical protein